MDEQKFTIKTEKFEGPMELLLSLIEKRKLHISEVSLAKVADDFIEYTRELESYPIADTAHFILTASTLLLIKSKSLLPALDLAPEEEKETRDLEARLRMYKKIKDLSALLGPRFGKTVMRPLRPRPRKPVFAPSGDITMARIKEAVWTALQNIPKADTLPSAVVEKVVSLEEMIESLTKRVGAALRMSFKDFAGAGKESKKNVIVSFLAMLELVKRGALNAVQNERFDDIILESEDVGTPRYE